MRIKITAVLPGGSASLKVEMLPENRATVAQWVESLEKSPRVKRRNLLRYQLALDPNPEPGYGYSLVGEGCAKMILDQVAHMWPAPALPAPIKKQAGMDICGISFWRSVSKACCFSATLKPQKGDDEEHLRGLFLSLLRAAIGQDPEGDCARELSLLNRRLRKNQQVSTEE